MATEQLSTATTQVHADRDTRELVIERVFDAPRARVWKAFTDSAQLEQWWGPRDWKTKNKRFELSVGGVWHYCMTGPDGTESWGKGTYREIKEPERLVYVDEFSDADGNAAPGMPGMEIVMEFIEEGANKTRVRSVTQLASTKDLESLLDMGVVQGISETWDRLAEHLAAG